MLAFFLTIGLGASHAPPDAPKPPAIEASLRPGMTAAEVRALLGPPQRIARQVIYKRCLEQWLYESPPLRLEFNSVQGQPSLLLTIQPLRPVK